MFLKKYIIRAKFIVWLLNFSLEPPNCILGPPNLGIRGTLILDLQVGCPLTSDQILWQSFSGQVMRYFCPNILFLTFAYLSSNSHKYLWSTCTCICVIMYFDRVCCGILYHTTIRIWSICNVIVHTDSYLEVARLIF